MNENDFWNKEKYGGSIDYIYSLISDSVSKIPNSQSSNFMRGIIKFPFCVSSLIDEIPKKSGEKYCSLWSILVEDIYNDAENDFSKWKVESITPAGIGSFVSFLGLTAFGYFVDGGVPVAIVAGATLLDLLNYMEQRL